MEVTILTRKKLERNKPHENICARWQIFLGANDSELSEKKKEKSSYIKSRSHKIQKYGEKCVLWRNIKDPSPPELAFLQLCSFSCGSESSSIPQQWFILCICRLIQTHPFWSLCLKRKEKIIAVGFCTQKRWIRTNTAALRAEPTLAKSVGVCLNSNVNSLNEGFPVEHSQEHTHSISIKSTLHLKKNTVSCQEKKKLLGIRLAVYFPSEFQ